MNFNHYYPKHPFTTPAVSQSHKICHVYINNLSTINILNQISPLLMTIDIFHQAEKKYYAIDGITTPRDGNDIIDGMAFIIDILNVVSSFAFSCLLMIVFDEIDVNFDEIREFIYGCDNNRDATMILSIKINIYYRKEYNFNLVNQIIIGVGDSGICNKITFIIHIVIKLLILPSFLDVLPIKFNGINSNLHQLIEFEYNHSNNNNTTVVLANAETIRGTTIVFEFFTIVIYFIMQIIGESSLNILLSIELDAIIVTIIQLVVKLLVHTITWAVFCHPQVIQVIYSVCGVFSLLFRPLSILLGLYNFVWLRKMLKTFNITYSTMSWINLFQFY